MAIAGTSRNIICHISRPDHSGTVVARIHAAHLAECYTEHLVHFQIAQWIDTLRVPSLHGDSLLDGVGSLDSSSIQFPSWIVDDMGTVHWHNGQSVVLNQ